MPSLTQKDFDVLDLVAQGLSRDQIADQLNISHYAVKNRLERIYLKLGISGKNRMESRMKLLLWWKEYVFHALL